jgi:hypothetical protein
VSLKTAAYTVVLGVVASLLADWLIRQRAEARARQA